MATPTASPQVASTVGLKNVVIAPLTEDTDTSHTYRLCNQKVPGNECSM